MESNVSALEISSSTEDKMDDARLIAKRRRSSATRSSVSLGKPKGKKIKGLKQPTMELSVVSETPKFSELRELSLFALGASNESPAFVKLNDRTGIRSVVLVLVPGIDSTNFLDFEVKGSPFPASKIPENLTFLQDNFTQVAPMNAPGDRESVYPLMKVFTKRPYTKQQKTRITKELTEKKIVLPDLSMTYEEMVQNNYPVHPFVHDEPSDDNQGWANTIKFEHEGSHTFALDCEMCDSASGKVLARVSMIDFEENVILDEYVKPDAEITDYLTRYSGITEELLRNVTTTVDDIQKKILSIVSSDDYLIGHSLENDLQVMRLRHPKIVDTALVFEHPRGPPFKSSLKYLTKQYLNRVIQEGEHDSVEDSKACLDLVKLKLVEGALLGKVIDGELIFNDLEKKDKKTLILDFQRVQARQDRYINCFNDDDVVEKLVSKVDEYDLIVANLKEIEFAQTDSAYEQKQNVCFKDLNKRLERIYESVPSNSLFIVSACYGDQTKMKELRGNKKLSRQEANENGCNNEHVWTWEHEQQLRECTTKTRQGVVFIKIKEQGNTSLE
jgi:RNA exonuclease 1